MPPPISPYRRINPEKIIETAKRLQARVQERFPDRGITQVIQEVVAVSATCAQKADWISRPILPLRMAVSGVTIILLVLAFGVIGAIAGKVRVQIPDLAGLLAMVEAGINDVILISAALYFLWSIEGRWKRKRALADLNELRAIAHIIDLHQLTKDPERLVHKKLLIGLDTQSSPERELDEFALSRYLDYCSEMLSLLSKIAALYPQHNDDPVVLAAVDEIETLTAGLSRKIWQKIMILNFNTR